MDKLLVCTNCGHFFSDDEAVSCYPGLCPRCQMYQGLKDGDGKTDFIDAEKKDEE